jgi:hypothetical protein
MATKKTPGYLGPPIRGKDKVKKPVTPPGGVGPGPVREPKKAQQALARRVKEAALKSGMDWTEWSEQRKTLVGAFRVKDSTKKSKAAIKSATKLIRASEGKKAAKAYAKKATKQDVKGAKKKSVRGQSPGGRPNPVNHPGYLGPPNRKGKGAKRTPGYQGGPTRKKK